MELETIGVWASRNDAVDGLERILVPLHTVRRNLETAVAMEMEDAEVQS